MTEKLIEMLKVKYPPLEDFERVDIYTIAFYGVVPIIPLVIGTFHLRSLLSAVDTLFIYFTR